MLGRRVRAQELAARAAVEQLDPALDRLGGILALDRAGIGLVHEYELAGIVARPHRRRHGFDQRAQGCGVVDLFAMALREFGELVFDAAHLSQPQDRPSPGHLALGFDDAAGERGHGRRKAHAARAQGVDPTLHVAGGIRLEPGAEGEHAVRRVGGCQQRLIADDLGLVGGGGPGHDDLRLGEEKRIGAVDRGLGCDGVIARRGLDLDQTRACAHEQDRRHHGKAENAERERERGNLVAIER